MRKEGSKVKIGDMVNYVLQEGPSTGQVRPAIVVQVWSSINVNLQVITDSPMDQSCNDGLRL